MNTGLGCRVQVGCRDAVLVWAEPSVLDGVCLLRVCMHVCLAISLAHARSLSCCLALILLRCLSPSRSLSFALSLSLSRAPRSKIFVLHKTLGFGALALHGRAHPPCR